MAKIDLVIPSLGNKFSDLRDVLPGDAYNFSWERDLSQVNFLVIHHTSTPDTQTPKEIAQSHINNNGWAGIGYHFLIDKQGLVYYVGDISTARANVANLNEQVVGIGLIGNFSTQAPSDEQLESTHKLCEFFLNYPALPNLTSWDCVKGHKELPNQTTNCPGESWDLWKTQIVEGVNVEIPSTILQSQVDSLQTSLASVNQQAISLQDVLQQRDQEITNLKQQLKNSASQSVDDISKVDTTLTIIGALINLYKFVFPPGKES